MPPFTLDTSTSSHEPLIDPFRSDLHAFEILRSRGLNETGVEIIKKQIAELSAGYRSPEKKLADVLEGGVVVQKSEVLLLHGFGGIERGKGSGECSESVRALTSAWSSSSMHRHLAKAGLYPFYLEVAAPRLFEDAWYDGRRVRSGHTALALGSPDEYVHNGSDESFIIIDPALGVIEPMNTSAYVQTGFQVVPKLEQRPQYVPLRIQEDGAPPSQQSEGVPSLVLGTDEETRFVYSLRMIDIKGYILPRVAVTDGTRLLLSFDVSQRGAVIHEQDEEMVYQALPKFLKLIEILLQNPLRSYDDAFIEGNYLVAGGNKIELIRELHYPQPPQMASSIAGLEAAATMALESGGPFSLLA